VDLRFIEDNLSGEAIRALIAYHLSGMHDNSPAGKVHALPLAGLRAADVTFWSAWVDADLAGMGAMKHLAPDHGELKSMRAAPKWRGKGVGDAMLLHLL
jgi:putative acetyltransferase